MLDSGNYSRHLTCILEEDIFSLSSFVIQVINV